MKIISYRILENLERSALERDVQEYLSQGWKLQGGIAVGLVDHPKFTCPLTMFAQAVTKEIDDANTDS